MKNAITPYRIANQIRLRRSAHLGTFLIVEGGSDKRVYERFVDCSKCEFSIAYGKENAVEALHLLEKDHFEGVLAIVDTDFWILEGKLRSSPNLIWTDYHDLEMMLLNSRALEKVLSERGSEEKVIKLGENIRTILFESGMVIGYLRWASLQFNYSLTFEELNFSKFVNKETLSVDVLKLIKTVKDHSQKHLLTEKDIQDSLEKLKNDSHDPLYVCCGHDLISILSIGLCKLLGSCKSSEVKPDTLEIELRLAYEDSFFRSTQLYLSIREWEENNKPYQVLSTEH